MAVAVGNTGQNATGLSTTTVTIGSYVVPAGSDRAIYLGVSQWRATDLQPTAAFNGSENFTVHDSQTIVEAPGIRRVTIFKLVNPTVTTANIVVTWSSAVDEAVCGATSWTGVDQTTPFGTAVKSTSGAGSSTVNITGAVGDVTHDTLSNDAGSGGAVANQTSRWNTIAASFTTGGEGQSAAGTGGSVAHTWSSLPGASINAHIGVAIQQSTGAAAGPLVGFTGTRRPPGTVGPFDRLGFLKAQVWDYTIPSTPATVDIAGTCCAGAVLRGAALTQSLALSPCPVRSTARLTGTLTQTQPVAGTSRSTTRLAGTLGTAQAIAGTVRSGGRLTGALGTKQAITGTVRSGARLTGATLLQSQPLTGSSRSLARLTGTMSAGGPGAVAIAGITRSTARMLGVTLVQTIPLAGSSRSIARARGVLAQSQAIAGVVRSTARLTGRLTQAQRIAGTVRALPRLLGATLTAIIPGSVAIAGTVRAIARLLGLPSITAPELVRIEVLEQVEAPAHVLAVEAPVWLAAVELPATVVPLTLPATLTVVDAPARIIPQT